MYFPLRIFLPLMEDIRRQEAQRFSTFLIFKEDLYEHLFYQRLFDILSRRYDRRDKRKPWVFWHRHWDRKKRGWIDKPYTDRKSLMRSLCKKAGVQYFRFHALRHFGASVLDQANIPIGSIQRILGHESRTTTEIYLHSFGEGEKFAMEVLNRQFAETFLEKSPTPVPHQKKGAMT